MILPYTEAVLLETLRRGNIAPLGVPHTMEKEIVIEGKVMIPSFSNINIGKNKILEPAKF